MSSADAARFGEAGAGPELADVFALAAAAPLPCAVDHFYFIRHGQTEGNASKRYQHGTIPLSALGRQQAEAAAEKLRPLTIREIFASSHRRAHDTAIAIAKVTGRPLTVTDELCERFFGDLIGTSWETAPIDWAAHPPNGETLQEFIDRSKSGLARALAAPGDPPLIVAHGGTLRVLVAALGAKVEEAARQNAVPLSFERSGSGWTVTLV